MSYIIIHDENGEVRATPAVNGEELTILAPCDCSEVGGVQINDVVYPFYDASGASMENMSNKFCQGSLIKVMIDTINKRCSIMNAGGKIYAVDGEISNVKTLMEGEDPILPHTVAKAVTMEDGTNLEDALKNTTSSSGKVFTMTSEEFKAIEDKDETAIYVVTDEEPPAIITPDPVIEWKKTAVVQDSQLWSCVYGNGIYVSDYGTYYSYDGIDWGYNASAYDIFDTPTRMCYGDGKFVALKYYVPDDEYFDFNNDHAGYYSLDGLTWNPISWTPQTVEFSDLEDIRSICYGGGKFIAIAINRSADVVKTIILYSSDGITWEDTSWPYASNQYLSGILTTSEQCVYGNGMFIINTIDDVAYSYDGLNWVYNDVDPNRIACLHSIIFNGRKFVAINGIGTITYHSLDGINWSASPTNLSSGIIVTHMEYLCDKYIMLGYDDNGAVSFISADAVNWAKITSDHYNLQRFSCMTCGSDKVIAIGRDVNDKILSVYADIVAVAQTDVMQYVTKAVAAVTAAETGALPVTGGMMRGAAVASEDSTSSLGVAQMRNIYIGTETLEAGTSALATGTLYLVYE